MKRTIQTALISVGLVLALPSCLRDVNPGQPDPIDGDSGNVTFVVSAPSPVGGVSGNARTRAAASPTGRGRNGHFPGGVPAGYRNYSDDADTENNGTLFGGYPDAEAEMAAFEKAVGAMAANYEKSPAAKSAGTTQNPGPSYTRAIEEGSEPDNRIEELTIVLFDPANNNKFVKMVKVGGANEPGLTPVAGDNTRWKFTLEKQEDCDYKAFFIANSRAAIETYLTVTNPDATLEEFSTELTVTQSGKWNATPFLADGTSPNPAYKPFPMSSQEVAFQVPSARDYSREPVELVRALAKINISTTLGIDFQIAGVVVLNKNESGRIVPSSGWGRRLTLLEENTQETVNEEASPVAGFNTGAFLEAFEDPTFKHLVDYPDAYLAPGIYDGVYNGFGDNVAVGTDNIEDEIFVFEKAATANVLDNLCLIVAAIDWKDDGGLGFSPGETNPLRYFRINLTKDPNPDDNVKELVPVDVVRNYRYDVVISGCNTMGYATVKEAYAHPDELEYTVLATEQNGMGDVTYNGEYQLTTDRSVVVVPAGETAPLKIYTDYEGGWSVSGEITATKNGVPTTGTTSANVKNVADEVRISTPINNGSVIIEHTIRIIAGELHKTITVISLPPMSNVTASSTVVTPYVGAYWRAEQTGERLIALEPDTDWSAFVLDAPADSPADWVVMDGRESSDTGVGTNPVRSGNDTDFDKKHPVNSTVSWATGTTGSTGGYLRLGARNAFAPSTANPAARYAVVLVIPGSIEKDNLSITSADYRLLYLRQGHEPDYLMRPGDPANGSPALGSRPLARKLSPYNLTAPGFRNETLPVQTEDELLSPRGGVFANYPTQAGAHFQFAPTYGLYAFNPAWPNNNTRPANFETNEDLQDKGANWNMMEAAYETCPPGYRRVTDGNNISYQSTIDVNSSELHQSLLQNASSSGIQQFPAVNSVWGLYADGWFDRRERATQPSTFNSGTNMAVDVDGYNVAYGGRLFYNPATRGSLFFPAAGRRENNSGYLGDLGSVGLYRTSTIQGVTRSWYMVFDKTVIARDRGAFLGHGFSIRCVAIPDYSDDIRIDLAQAPPGVIGIKHSDLVALQSGRKQLGDGSYNLTIKGSNTYKNTWVERIAVNEGLGALEEEPVYMVYYKWGSTVAVLGGADGDTFGPEDVVWVHPDFTGSITGFNDITTPAPVGISPPSHVGTGTYNIPTHVTTAGHGDPCDLVNGGTVTNPSGWKTPIGSPWTYSDGEIVSTPFGTTNTPVTPPSIWDRPDIDAQWRENENFNGFKISGAATDDGMVFLPAAGYRSGMDSGFPAYGQGERGYYWSSSAESNTAGFLLTFYNEEPSTTSNTLFVDAHPIRCVRPTKVGNKAVKGVIGYYADGPKKGELTLEGDKDYYSTGLATQNQHTVYVAHFKFGSLVAIGSDVMDYRTTNSVWFDRNDIVAAPSEYNYGGYSGAEAVKAAIGTTTNQQAWEMIKTPDILSPRLATGDNVTAKLVGPTYVQQALGDPCVYYADQLGKGWRLPVGGDVNGSWDGGTFGNPAALNATLSQAGAEWLDENQHGVHPAGIRPVGSGWSMFLPAYPYRSWQYGSYAQPMGVYGGYQSSTASGPGASYNLNFTTINGPYVRTRGNDEYAMGFTVRCVIPEPKNVVMAAPGMPGIKRSAYLWLMQQRATRGATWIPRTAADWQDYTNLHGHPLTIKGSSTYAGTWVETNIANGGKTDEFTANGYGGLETEPVYTLYFKWGSMVAMIGGGSSSGGGDTWSIDDVVWVNPEFDPATITASTDEGDPGYYGSFTPAPTDGGPYNTASPGQRDFGTLNPALGHGDICMELTGGEWQIPTGWPFDTGRAYSGVNSSTGTTYPFGDYRNSQGRTWAQSRSTDMGVTYWLDASGPASGVTFSGGYSVAQHVPIGLSGTQGQAVSDNQDLFMPAAGYRESSGSVGGQGTYGNWWSSSADSSTSGYRIDFTSNDVYPSYRYSYYANGFPIRCVKPEPSLPQGVRAPAGVIGYYAKDPDGPGPKKLGDLTLEGDKSLQDEHGYGGGTSRVPVYVAYFKFGSLVATSSDVTPSADFTSDDIIASPSIWNNLDAAKAYIGNDWSKIPSITEAYGLEDGDELSGQEDILNGIGDACRFWFGADGWRMPTKQENVDFVGTADGQLWYTWNPRGASAADPGFYTFLRGTAQGAILPAAGTRNLSGSVQTQGTNGNYWSSTAGEASGYGRTLFFDYMNVRPASNGESTTGYTIRCVNTLPIALVPDEAIDPLDPVSNDGGVTTPIAIRGVPSTLSNLTWTGTVAIDDPQPSNPSGKKAVKHTPRLVDAATETPIDANSPQPVGKKFRVEFPKVYYPNRDVPLSATVTVTLANGRGTDRITVYQESLTEQPVTAYNYRAGIYAYGSITNYQSSYADAYKTALGTIDYAWYPYANEGRDTYENFHVALPSDNKVTISGVKKEITYLHAVINYLDPTSVGKGTFGWDKVNDWRAANDGLLVIAGHDFALGIPASPTRDILNYPDSPLKLAGYPDAVYNGSFGGGNLTQNYLNTPAAPGKKVFTYLMGESPGTKIGASYIERGFYSDGLNAHIPVAGLPASAVPLVVNTISKRTAGNTTWGNGLAASLLIDVENGFMFIGETEHFNAGNIDTGTSYLSHGRNIFLKNLMHFVKNTAAFGTHFTDLLLEGDNAGVNPRSFTDVNGRKRIAQPAPWDESYWGANADHPFD